jgi:dTDP-glucose pyrophosphorylase
MRKLQIVLPMVGLGSRFANAGFTTPKPLIDVDGLPMFRKALSSLEPIQAEKSYHFVIRQEHVDTQQLDMLIKNALPEANVIVLPEITRGAAESALAARDHLNAEDGLILLDCDLWFKSASYYKMVESCLDGSNQIDGGVLTFPADNPRYSYAEIGDNDMVIRTAEKVVISNTATTGAYFFATARTFADAATELLTQPLNDDMKEYYISFVYGLLLKQGKKIQAAYVDEFASFGTPEELADYEAR